MKRSWGTIAAGVALLLAGGCQSAPARPASGRSAVSVRVTAEPKIGTPESGLKLKTFDTPTARGSGAFEKLDYAGLDNIIVWAEPASTSGQRGTGAVAIDLDSASTAVRPVAVGQTIVFHHSAAGAMPVYSESDGNDFVLTPIASGASGTFTVRSAGLIEVWSDPAKEPVALLYAAPTRWVAAARSGETVELSDLPPGACTIYTWHPRLPGSQTQLNLAPDQTAQTTLHVGVNALPKIAPAPR